MSAGDYRLTEVAEADIEGILDFTAREFGPRQQDRYARLIEKAARMVAADPERAGSRERGDLGTGVRSFHLERAAGRRGGGSHVLFYFRGRFEDGADGVVIVRVLHDMMEPAPYIAAGLL